MSSGYREQYARAKRWQARLATLDAGREHVADSDNYVDDMYAFFMNCYHLKDWIRNDPDVSESIGECVEGHINSSRPLKLCGDICNSLKHLVVTKPRSGENPLFGSRRFRLALGGGAPKIGLTYEITTAGGNTDAFTLANECMEAWDQFLSAHHLG